MSFNAARIFGDIRRVLRVSDVCMCSTSPCPSIYFLYLHFRCSPYLQLDTKKTRSIVDVPQFDRLHAYAHRWIWSIQSSLSSYSYF
jgi:hypothetical protein